MPVKKITELIMKNLAYSKGGHGFALAKRGQLFGLTERCWGGYVP